MLKLHNENVERNGLSMDNIMLHREVDGIMKTGVCKWGCGSPIGENVESLWHTKPKKPKDFLRIEKWKACCIV